MRVNSTSLSLLAGLALAACGGGAATAPPAAAPKDVPSTQPVAVAPAPAPAPVPPPPPPPPTPEMIQQQTATRYAECVGYLNGKDFENLAACYAPDATGEVVDVPGQYTGGAEIVGKMLKPIFDAFSDFKPAGVLRLVNGTHVATVVLLTGTNDGSLMGMPATKKKIGLYGMRSVEINADGRIKSDAHIADMGTWIGQLGVGKLPHRPALPVAVAPAEPTVVLAKHDKAEADNLAVVNSVCEAFNKHDLKATMVFFADGAVWSDQTFPADLNKKTIVPVFISLFKAFPDFQGTCAPWAAGDYVFNIVDWTATNKGAMPPFLKKPTGKALHLHDYELYQLAGGKVTHYWRFSNSMAMMGQLGLLGGTPPPPAPAPAPAKKTKPPAPAKKAAAPVPAVKPYTGPQVEKP